MLGFKHPIPAETGRPSYDPSNLLKLHIYDHLNQVRSSGKLEKECDCNVEVMWLMKKLAPDFKAIADIRKDNVDCIKGLFQELVYLCKSLDLYGDQLIALEEPNSKLSILRATTSMIKQLLINSSRRRPDIGVPQRIGQQRRK